MICVLYLGYLKPKTGCDIYSHSLVHRHDAMANCTNDFWLVQLERVQED